MNEKEFIEKYAKKRGKLEMRIFLSDVKKHFTEYSFVKFGVIRSNGDLYFYSETNRNFIGGEVS